METQREGELIMDSLNELSMKWMNLIQKMYGKCLKTKKSKIEERCHTRLNLD